MRVRVAHASLQFSDTNKQHTEDLEKIFEYLVANRVAWCTGTEAGDGAKNTPEEIIRLAQKHGYYAWVPSEQSHGPAGETDCWIVVRKDLISGNVKKGFIPAILSSEQLYKDAGHPDAKYPRWGRKGLVNFAFDCDVLQGRVNIGCGHYLTNARHPNAEDHGVNRWELNEDLAEVIDKWAKDVAKGRDLAFYAGDQNMADSHNDEPQGDTFFGGQMTSLADELKDWQNTGHGPIDVIATYNKDKRVSAVKFEVLDDKEIKLNMDHFLLTGIVNVEPVGN